MDKIILFFIEDCFFPEKSVEITITEWEEFKFKLIDIKKTYQLLQENLTDDNLRLAKSTSE